MIEGWGIEGEGQGIRDNEDGWRMRTKCQGKAHLEIHVKFF